MSHSSPLPSRLQVIPATRSNWRRQPLTREITLILLLKIILITLLWWAFFYVPDARRIHTAQVSAHVVGGTLSTHHNHLRSRGND